MSIEIDHKNISAQQFADQVSSHGKRLAKAVENTLPPALVDAFNNARLRTREALELTPDDIIVIFGEQTYGLNEPPKVIGKRLLAKGLEQKHGIRSIELFASFDMAGTEGGIYRMQLPSPTTPEGYCVLNVLSGWKKRKYAATAGFRCPTPEEMQRAYSTMESLYRSKRAIGMREFLTHYYGISPNYAEANIDILRSFEKQIGLQVETSVREESLDTKLAQNGGMQIMLHMWPELSRQANNHNHYEGVRVPNGNEAPFQLYHTTDPSCVGRMITHLVQKEGQVAGMDSQVYAKCMQCSFEETTSPQDIINQGRPLTWKAIPRVVLYSTIVADGHITGGGSIYNQAAKEGSERIGIPYFPITWMDKQDQEGNKVGVFNYQSTSTFREKGAYVSEAKSFVREGKAAMADLVLSIGVEQLKGSIEEILRSELTTSTRVVCPETVLKPDSKVINI